MKKNCIKKTAAVIAAALTIFCCGISASAESIDIAEVPAASEVNDYAVVYGYDDYDGNYDYNYNNDNAPATGKSKSEPEKKNWLQIILIALGVSIVGTGLTVYFIYRGYKYNGMTEPYEYKDKAPLELSDREDVLIDVQVTTRHIERNNNNN